MNLGIERPDLSELPPEVIAYIEALEAALEQPPAAEERELPLEPSEPPTTINVITVSANGLAKRTLRHFYSRQRRGGMGVFGMDVVEGDAPKFLVLADISAHLTVITNQGRAFRMAVSDFVETPVAGRGKSVLDRFPLRPDEHLALLVGDPLPGQPSSYLVLVTVRGQVRRIGMQYWRNLQSGVEVHNVAEGGAPAAATWSSGNDDLMIATRSGNAIRFHERLVPVRGCLGMRVDPSDAIVGVAAADGTSGGAFMVGNEGKGTIRLYSGFSANKAPGSGGKVLMKADELLGVQGVREQDDVFVVSRLGKIIRFAAAEVPAKEGVVQGVNCMALRADECVAFAVSPGS